MLVLAHISDTHIDADPESAARTAQVMDYLNRLPHPVDAILVTGDIADQGELAAYELAAKLLVSPYPVLTCPGNHDLRDAYRRGLMGEPDGGDEPINRRHDLGGATVLLGDSSIPGRDEGRLDPATLGWFADQLAATPAGTPVLVGFHHPPVELHQPFVDSIRLQAAGSLADLLAAHPEVVAVLCGHAHTAAASTFAGRPVLVAPGVISTLRLPWEGEGPVVDRQQPPGVAFHVLDGSGRLTTHYRVVP
jgi:3',5'-cyclic AMP phosphodiesterase CpdA